MNKTNKGKAPRAPWRLVGWRAGFEFKLADLWVGAFWKRCGNCIDVWVCFLPCLPLHISWWWTREPDGPGFRPMRPEPNSATLANVKAAEAKLKELLQALAPEYLLAQCAPGPLPRPRDPAPSCPVCGRMIGQDPDETSGRFQCLSCGKTYGEEQVR